MAYDQISDLNQINNDAGTNLNCRVSYVVEYTCTFQYDIAFR